MSLHTAAVTFDCDDAAALAGFWSAAFDVPIDEGASRYMARISAAAPPLLFLAVGEPKTAKTRVHLDLTADDRAAEVARLVDLGATHVEDHDAYGVRWTVLQDPAGTEFCVADPH